MCSRGRRALGGRRGRWRWEVSDEGMCGVVNDRL